MVDEVKELELAAGTKIPGDKIDHVVLKAGFKYPLPEKAAEAPASAPAAEPPKPDGETVPPGTPPEGEKKPDDAQAAQLKEDLEEVNAVKTIISNKILQTELSGNASLNVEVRKAELMKLKLNDLTKLLPKAAPDGTPPGEGYVTELALSQGAQQGKKTPTTLRDIIEMGVDGGVL